MVTVAIVVAIVVLAATYLTWTAGRLDRLHARVDAAAAALDAQLVRRAAACATAASAGLLADALPAAEAARLGSAAHVALTAHGLGPEREAAENALSRAIRAAAAQAPTAFAPGTPAADELATAAVMVALARRFHSDAVRGALDVRGRRIPRLFRLAGHAPMPTYFEIDDTVVPAQSAAPPERRTFPPVVG